MLYHSSFRETCYIQSLENIDMIGIVICRFSLLLMCMYSVGTQATGTQLAEYCGHALLALEVLIHPRSLPLSDFHSGGDDYKALGDLREPVYPSGEGQIPNYQHDEPESEEDDLFENWLGKDDEMEIQVTKKQPDEVASGTDAPKSNEVTTSGNAPDNKGMASTDVSDQAALESVELEPASGRGASVEDDVTAKSGTAGVSETTGNEFSTIFERISANLSNIDRSKETVFEADDEADDIFPDIVDGDPDSD